MYAYSELYLEDAMQHLGEMLDYAVHDLQYDIDVFWQMFYSSHAGQQFSTGNPKYNAGMSGVELAMEIIYEKTGEYTQVKPSRWIDCSKEFWVGWVLAFYQYQKNVSFKRLAELGLGAGRVYDMYILHEADIQKFCAVADSIVSKKLATEENRLKRLRKYAELTQKQLSEKSGVTLRMIQLYEQGQNDLTKAQASVVLSLAKALHCTVEDLI